MSRVPVTLSVGPPARALDLPRLLQIFGHVPLFTKDPLPASPPTWSRRERNWKLLKASCGA